MPTASTLPTRHRRGVFALPSTRLGVWAARVAGLVVVWFVLLGWFANLELSDAGWAARAFMIASGLTGVAAAISSGVAAVVAVVRGERSIVLLVPLLVGAFWVMFVLGEFLSPH